jgi:hypothetical protein
MKQFLTRKRIALALPCLRGSSVVGSTLPSAKENAKPGHLLNMWDQH